MVVPIERSTEIAIVVVIVIAIGLMWHRATSGESARRAIDYDNDNDNDNDELDSSVSISPLQAIQVKGSPH
jgi:hypothetical protein